MFQFLGQQDVISQVNAEVPAIGEQYKHIILKQEATIERDSERDQAIKEGGNARADNTRAGGKNVFHLQLDSKTISQGL